MSAGIKGDATESEILHQGATAFKFDNTGITSGIIKSGTATATTSGTSIDYTSIPSGVKKITISFFDVSTNGTSHKLIQIGTGGSPTTTGYNAVGHILTTAIALTGYTAGFGIRSGIAAATVSGAATLTLLDSSDDTWAISGVLSQNVNNYTFLLSGSVALAGTLDMIRLTTANGTDTYDGGKINILYES